MKSRLPILLLILFLLMVAFAVATRADAAPPNPKMPAVLARIGKCETGMNWQHSTRDYATAFGIHRAAWQDYRKYVPNAPRRPEDATPAQQVAVALAIYRHAGAGWHAWGCYRHAWVRG